MTLLHPKVEPTYVFEPDTEALIREARRLRRRRWTVGVMSALIVGLCLWLALVGLGKPTAPRTHQLTSSGGTATDSAVSASVVPGQPTADVIAPNGNLYVADAKRNQVLERLPSGKFVAVIGTGRTGFSKSGDAARRTSLERIESMLVAPNGDLYLAEQFYPQVASDSRGEISEVGRDGIITTVVGGGKSCVVSPNGTPARHPAFGQIEALTTGPGGNLYFIGNTCGTAPSGPLFELTGSGAVVAVPEPTAATRCDPTAVTFAADGDLYLACFDAKNILIITPNKTISWIEHTYPYDEFGGLVTAPNGQVIAGDFLKVDSLTPTGKRTIADLGVNGAAARSLGTSSFGGRTYPNTIEPNGIAVSKSGDIFVAATSGFGNGDTTTIIEVFPSGQLRVLWRAATS